MSQFRAILLDSLYESIDRKALLVVLILSSLAVAFTAGISFETEQLATVLERQCVGLGSMTRGHGFWSFFGTPVECKTSDIKPASAAENWRSDVLGGYAVTLNFKNQEELDQLVRNWRTFKSMTDARGGREPNHPPRVPVPDEVAVSPAERLQFLDVRFQRMGYAHVQSRMLQEAPPIYRVAVRTDYPHELLGASYIKLLFGAIRFPLLQRSVAESVVQIQLTMANTFAGFIGVLVAVLVCSGFVPSMLQKGTLDLVLARPIGRGRLLLYKYVGGLWFVFLMSSVLIGGCWLAMSLRTGYANPWFLATILTITATFAVIHSVSVLVGVLTRSGTVAALVAIFVWGTSSVLLAIRNGLKLAYIGQSMPNWLRSTIDVLYDLAPKTLDLNALNTSFLARSHLSEQAFQRAFGNHLPQVDWAWSLGTTAAFTVVMLALAVWFFRRKDY
ncbi:MAG TPA: ABC transporter permease [Planctomycetota bacterium]|jgi:ABC-type transport system involved in multi-copper enzyme maturation permease subunit